MKKSSVIAILAFAIAAGSAISCSDKAEFISGYTPIKISVENNAIRATQLKVSIEPENDKVYYFCDVVEKSVHTPGQGDLRFMQLTLDSLYRDYIDWRYQLLRENANYVAPFSSHCLSYGKDYRIFLNLKPNTNYYVYAYCVNPETNQPIGGLYTLPIKTTEVKPSTMTFTWERKGTHVAVTPSNDEELYIWDVVEEEMLTEWYDSDPEEYLKEYVEAYIAMDMLRDDICQSITGFNFDYMFQEGGTYYFIVAGYDGEFTTPVYSEKFTIDKL